MLATLIANCCTSSSALVRSRRRLDTPKLRHAFQTRQEEIRTGAQPQDQPFLLAILRRQHDASRAHREWVPRLDRSPFDEDFTALRRFSPANCPQDFGSPGPKHPGDAENFAAPHRKRDVVKFAWPAQSADFQQRVRSGHKVGGPSLLDDLSKHHVHDRLGCCIVEWHRADKLAVTEDGDGVRDMLQFLQPMRDMDNGDALGGQLPDQPEQLFGFVPGERRGRLIEHQYRRLKRHCLGNFNRLLLGHAQVADDLAGIQAGFQFVQ